MCRSWWGSHHRCPAVMRWSGGRGNKKEAVAAENPHDIRMFSVGIKVGGTKDN